jgi:HK97 family phage portal protein
MPSSPSLRARVLAAAQAWAAGSSRKDGAGIWGDAFTSFMGMSSSGSGPPEIKDNPTSYAGARTAESYVYTCREVRGRAVSQVPLRCWQTDPQGKRKAIEHDALGVLETTNPFGWVDGIPALMRMTMDSLDIQGRSAWRLAFDRRNRPSEVYWTAPTTFAPIPDPKTFIRGIRVHEEGSGVRDIPYSEICYFVSDNPLDPLMGTSKIAVLKNPINLRSYSQHNNIDFFKNSMRPDWMLSGNFANTEDNIARIRRGIRRMLSGANNRAPLILGEGMTAHLLTTSHEDAQWVEQQRLAQEEISAVFGVPLIYLNNLERATYENIKTAKLILWHDTMIPDCDDLADRLNRRFLWRFWPETRDRKITFGFDYSEIEGLGEDLALIWERVVNMSKQLSEQVRQRELTPHEARALRDQLFGDLGLDTSPFSATIPGGDTFYELFTNVPVDQLSVQAVMNIWGMRGQNPEFIEDVPGAPTAGANADDVVDRLATPPPAAPSLPAPATPALPDPTTSAPAPPPPPPPESTPPPPKGIDLEALRAQAAAQLRQDVAAAVGEAAVHAFGEALKARQQPADDGILRRLKRHFGDQQTDALRALRQALSAGAPLPADLYSRRVYGDRLAELLAPEVASAVEAETQAAIRLALRSPAAEIARAVTAVFRDAIDRRATEIAAGNLKAPDQPKRPLEAQLEAAERYHADQVAQTLSASADPARIAAGWEPYAAMGRSSKVAGGASIAADLVALALDYLRSAGLDFSGLGDVLRAIYTDGWRLGIGSALAHLTGRSLPANSLDPATGIDWSAWQPGNAAAATRAAGLSELLEQAGIVLKGISDTTLDQIAQALAQGAADGDSVDTIAASLRDLLGDGDRAWLIAQTELARATSAASLDVYAFNGIAGKSWLTFNPCPLCARNEGIVIPLDGVFPSGDQAPPGHPRCRCAVVPEANLPEQKSALVLLSATAGVEVYG